MAADDSSVTPFATSNIHYLGIVPKIQTVYPSLSLAWFFSRISIFPETTNSWTCIMRVDSLLDNLSFWIRNIPFFYHINKFYLREQILNDNDKLIDFDCINSLLIVLSNDKYAINFIILPRKKFNLVENQYEERNYASNQEKKKRILQ